jgi:hypothetical protein
MPTMTTTVYLPRLAAPTSGMDSARAVPLPGIPPIAGNNFAVLTNGWQGWYVLADHLAKRLKDAGAADVLIVERERISNGAMRPENDEFLDGLATKVAGAIAGLGNCGSCTSWSCSDSLQLERRGVRSAHVVVENFRFIATAVAKAQNQGDHPIVVLPPRANELSSEELAPLADEILLQAFNLEPTR